MTATLTGTPCATIHRDGTYTYFDPFLGAWVQNAPFVPAHIRETLPEEERVRVERAEWRRMGER
jgi:hypothetical protein